MKGKNISSRARRISLRIAIYDGVKNFSHICFSDAARVINTAIESITAALKKGQNVTLVGFGTFKISKRKARKGRNPRTGEVINIKATKVPRFTAGKGLKDAV